VHCVLKLQRCLAGAARDPWDQINVLEEEDEVRDELIFDNHLKELTSAILGDDGLRNQKDYLKDTPKPDKMSVKEWINRIKNINSYLHNSTDVHRTRLFAVNNFNLTPLITPSN
jgi:hypothetical protein